MSMRSLLFCLLALTAAAHADVLEVRKTTGPFTTIQSAVDAAADGDTILVSSFAGQPVSFFETVVIDGKGLRLVSDENPFTIEISRLVIRNLGPSQTLSVEGFRINPVADDGADGTHVRDCEGPVRLANSSSGANGHAGSISGGTPGVDGGSAVRIVDCDDVSVVFGGSGGRGGDLDDAVDQAGPTNGGHGLEIIGSTVWFTSGTAGGGPGGNVNTASNHDGGDGGYGILNRGGALYLSTNISGGFGGDAGCTPSCGTGGMGGHALRQELGGSSTIVRVSTASPGGPGAGLPPAHADVYSLLAGSFLDHDEPRGIPTTFPVSREGEPGVLSASAGQDGDDVFLLLSLQTGAVYKPGFLGPYLLGVLLVPDLHYLGTSTGFSVRPVGFITPDLPVGLEDATLWFQMATLRDGSFLLDGVMALTIVDSSF